MPNFPVRLAGEIFKRCLEYCNKKENITLYDPCCGGSYLLTVLGLLNLKIIKEIIAFDVSEEAINLSKSNLSLLSEQGLLNRKVHIEKMIADMDKPSHKAALVSVNRFLDKVKTEGHKIKSRCFVRNILYNDSLKNEKLKADVVIVDVPYGNLVEWSQNVDGVNIMLNNLIPVLHKDSIIAVIMDKSQKINVSTYHRMEKFKVGKRVIYILKYGGFCD